MLVRGPVSSSKGFYLFAALWWPVDILEDLKWEVDPLHAGQNADMMMIIITIIMMNMMMMEVLDYYFIQSSR